MSHRFIPAVLSGCLAAISFAGACVLPAVADTTAPSPSWQLTVQGGRMTALVQDAPLEMIMREISRRVRLAVSIQGPVARDLVTVRFQNLPVEEGIRKVLEGKEYAIIHNPSLYRERTEAGLSSVREILVFSRPGSGANEGSEWMKLGGAAEEPRAPAPAGAVNGPKLDNPLLRLEEMSDLADEDELLPALARALEDQDARVRAKAMEILEDTLGPIPVGPLSQIAETERDPLMRSRALTLLAFRGEGAAVQPLTRALQDPAADVRELASELLKQLGLTTPAQPTPPATLP